jgi:glycosyltransferase involved in cell wall biosynthesis
MGAAHRHRPDGAGPLGRLKAGWYSQVFRRAAALTTWSRWARDSLVRDYGVEAGKIAVIPPGVILPAQPHSREVDRPESPVRLLFVGSAFKRKGGDLLMEAFRAGLSGRCELDIVTRDGSIEGGGPVRVHQGLNPGDEALMRLFAEADLFVLPTLGDCLPLAVLEAMAHGLPVVASDVGAISEAVEAERTGLLCAPGDVAGLRHALSALIEDPARRRAFGITGRLRAEQLFDARGNYRRLTELIKGCVDNRDGSSAGRWAEPATRHAGAARIGEETTPLGERA